MSDLEQKASRALSAGIIFPLRGPAWSDRSTLDFSEQGYQRNVIAFRCVTLSADAIASLPWRVEIGGEEDPEHAAMALLREPNPMDDLYSFMEAVSSWIDIAGETFIELAIESGTPELYCLKPDRFTIELSDRGYPQTYIYKVNGAEVRFDMTFGSGEQQPILHIKRFNPTNEFRGLSAFAAGGDSVEIFNAASDYQKALLDNGAAPTGALTMKGKNPDGSSVSMTDDHFNRLKAEIEEQYAGPSNAGRPLVLDGGLEWVPMGQTLEELDFINGKREMAREICLSLGVPAMLLGLPGDNTYANFAEANRAFYRQTILPKADRIARALTRFLRPTFGDDFRLTFNIEDIPALEIEREARWRKTALADWITWNEAREATGFSKTTWGDARRGEVVRGQGERGPDKGESESRDIGATPARDSTA